METKELLENISNLCATAIPAPQEFNIFRICGIAHYELRHSAIIAEFLNPEGSHGCKAFFLRHFFDTIGIEYKNVELENAKIYTEYATTCGRFDIFIDLGNKSVIIENKVYASEGNGQLASYRQYLDKHKGGDLIYLTPRGEKSSAPQSENIEYKAISYQKDIKNWLADCIVHIPDEKNKMTEFLRQYIKFWEDLLVSNSGMLREIVDCIQNNFNAARVVAEQFDFAKAQMVLEYLGNYDILTELIPAAVKNEWKLSIVNDSIEKINTGRGLDFNFEYSTDLYAIRYGFCSYYFVNPRVIIIIDNKIIPLLSALNKEFGNTKMEDWGDNSKHIISMRFGVNWDNNFFADAEKNFDEYKNSVRKMNEQIYALYETHCSAKEK